LRRPIRTRLNVVLDGLGRVVDGSRTKTCDNRLIVCARGREHLCAERSRDLRFDLVVDTVGGATLDASFAAVKHFGHVVSALGWGTHALAPLSFREATYSGAFTLHALLSGKDRAHHGEMLREATRLVEAGKLAPRVDPRRFDLGSAEFAYEALVNGTARGKIVVDVT
jgi:NADPH:quinone reductase